MPIKKRSTLKRTTAVENVLPLSISPSELPAKAPGLPVRKIALGVLVVGLLLVLWTQKGRFVAAVVNGKPIFRGSVTESLESRYGQQVLEGLINESIIAGEAKKAGVSVSQADVDAKEQELIANLGEKVSLDEVLKFQGLTRAEFDNQVRLQLQVERILAKDLSITEVDVDQYIASNRALLTATQPAALRDEARAALKNQKLSAKVQTWFAEVQKAAQVSRFVAW